MCHCLNLQRSKQEKLRKSSEPGYGSLWFIGGLIVTFRTMSLGGGTFIVTWGAIVFGGLQLIKGVIQRFQYSSNGLLYVINHYSFFTISYQSLLFHSYCVFHVQSMQHFCISIHSTALECFIFVKCKRFATPQHFEYYYGNVHLAFHKLA